MNEEEQAAANPDQPPYLYIADVLRGEIHDGLFRVGQRLPSQAELEKRFNVSRPTVQRALTELRREGYLDNQRGRSAEVLDWAAARTSPRGPQDEPGPTFQILDRFTAEAFQAQHVTIDAYSLSAETLNAALLHPLNRVLSGDLTPRSIRLRLLLPAPEATLAIPRPVEGDGVWPLERMRELQRAQVVSLRSSFRQLADVQPDIDQLLEIRVVPITPLDKLYILNGTIALSGRYHVVRRTVAHRQFEGEIFDVLGVGAVLFPYRADSPSAGDRDARLVAENRAWFDSLWSTIARTLTLT